MDNFSKQTVTFESPEEYAEWKKVYWSDENIAYMQHVTAMEKKYGKNFEKMLNSMTDKEYEKYKRLLDNNPMYKPKVTLVKNAEEAKTALKNRIGFRNCNIDSMDERLIVDNTNQLIRLESKFGVIHKSDFVDIDVDEGNFAGNVNSSRLSPASQYLVLNKKRYTNRDSLIKKEIKDMDSGYSMPFSHTNEEASIATVTHEYGHMLQNVIKKDYMESLGWKNSDMLAFVNKSAKTDKAKYKWYADVQKTVQNNCYDEIIAIAKRNNPAFDLDANISEYGKTSKAEFFAEVFANSQLGKPNELGVAMNEWLNKKYLANGVENGTIKLSNIDVRKKYIEEVSKIKGTIDNNLPIEQQARQAFEARNRIRTEARSLMADEATRVQLEKERPNKTFEELISSKMKRKGMTRDEAIRDIYDTATKTNANVNRELGLGGD